MSTFSSACLLQAQTARTECSIRLLPWLLQPSRNLLCGGDRRHRTQDRFSGDSFTGNLMCSIQPKLPVFGSHLKGEMPANASVLGASHSQLREEPPKRPPSDDGCLGTALDISGYRDAIVWQDFSAFPAISLMQWTSLDVLERYWMVGRVATKFSA